jgi:hypothetical protein
MLGMRRWVFALGVGVSILPVFSSHSLTQKASSSRIFFYPDDNHGFENAKPPSDTVLDALLASAEVKDRLDEIEDQSRESLRHYFSAIPTDAGTAEDQIYVVTSTGLPLGSGDSDWFWMVRTRKQEATVILFTIGHTLRFQQHRTNGYRDLRETTGTPVQPEENLYRYDGAVYRLLRTRLRKEKP